MDVYNLNKKRLIQKIILKEIDKLISSAENAEDQRIRISCFDWVSEISIPCMEALQIFLQVA